MWAVLALAIGLAGGVVLTAAAGARRTGTAYQRFLATSQAEDVFIAGLNPGDRDAAKVEAEMERLPQVVAASPVAAMILIEAGDARPALRPGLTGAVGPYHFAGVDRRYGDSIDRPNVVAGRRPRPDRAEEVMVNRALARAASLSVGDTIDLATITTEQANTPGFVPRKANTTPVHLRVVGIGVYPNEVVPTASYDSLGFFYLTPAFYRTHVANTQGYGFEVIRLRRGLADVAAFRAGVNQILVRHHLSLHDILFSDRADRNASVRRAIGPQAVALGLFAGLAGLASVLVIGQMLARRTFLDADDNSTLSALGMSRGQLLAFSLAKVATIALFGGALAVVLAALASPLMPIGPARLAEPRSGFAINVAILGIGFACVVGVLLLIVALPAWRAANTGAELGGSGSIGFQRRSRVVEAMAGAGAPVTSIVGVRAALQAGNGRTSVPVRSTLVVSGLAIAMVVTSFTFTSNLNRLVHTPREYGWMWDLKAGNGFFNVKLEEAMAGINADRDVAAVAGINYGDVRISGRSVPAVGLDDIRGTTFPALLEGRRSRRDDEIVLGTRTLRRIHRGVGDTIPVSIDGPAQVMHIVGRAVFPKLGAGNFAPTNLGEGAVVRARYFGNGPEPDERFTGLLIRLRGGADVAANRTRLNQVLGPMEFCGGDSGCVSRADPPGDISNYGRTRGTTFALAAALAVMAIGAIGHGLFTSVRRRRRDLALLKTIGFTRRQVSATTVWQATVTAVAALVLGLPVGIGLGRAVWRAFADQLGVDPHPRTPVAPLLLAVAATIVVTNIIAAVPAVIAARTLPAEVLRSE